ncbi:RDD family protein [Nocardia sp. NPDC058705]|uniref:RDD family protein n=1 Tax=Nocardia sp. NPDC058705 TaxID=3346609 RepID=UPI003689B9E3
MHTESPDRLLPRAWATPGTLWSLIWTTLRSLTVLACGIACMFAWYQSVVQAESAYRAAERESSNRAALFFFFAFLPLTITGLVMVRTSLRRVWAARHRWQLWHIETHRPQIQEWVHLINDQGTITATLVLRKWISRTFEPGDQVVWFAGHPNKAGLVAKPGGARTRLAYRSLFYTAPAFGSAVKSRAEPTMLSKPEPSAAPSEFTLERDGGQTVTRPPTGHPQSPLHGGLDDNRFPSPRKLRRTLAYLLDIVAHVAIGSGIYLAVTPALRLAISNQDWHNLPIDWFAVICCSVLASFIDRVVLQAITHTTVGKAVFGLVIIDRDTGRYPRFRWLLASWLVSGLLAIQLPFALIELGGIAPKRPERYMLPAVRRRDVRAGAPNVETPPTDTTTNPSGPESEQSYVQRRRESVGDGIIGPST